MLGSFIFSIVDFEANVERCDKSNSYRFVFNFFQLQLTFLARNNSDAISLLSGLANPVPDLFEVLRLRIVENFEADAKFSQKIFQVVEQVQNLSNSFKICQTGSSLKNKQFYVS